MSWKLEKAQIEEQFGAQLASGKVVVVAMERSEKGHINIQLAQQASASAADIFFGGSIRIGWQSVKAPAAMAAIEKAGVGATLDSLFPGAWRIQRIEGRQPFYQKKDGSWQTPVINPTTGEIVEKFGAEYYLRFEVVYAAKKDSLPQDISVGANDTVEATKPTAESAIEA